MHENQEIFYQGFTANDSNLSNNSNDNLVLYKKWLSRAYFSKFIQYFEA
jgi:hypothetical protein